MLGTVKRINENGFGFIAPETGEKDVFFHMTALIDVTIEELKEGDKVSFDLEDSEKGPRAVNVQRA